MSSPSIGGCHIILFCNQRNTWFPLAIFKTRTTVTNVATSVLPKLLSCHTKELIREHRFVVLIAQSIIVIVKYNNNDDKDDDNTVTTTNATTTTTTTRTRTTTATQKEQKKNNKHSNNYLAYF